MKKRRCIRHVYSHRGASGEEVEHTFAAYDLAIKYGSKYIEQDIVTSKDGTLIVSHDLSAKRMTGVNKLYADMTDKEISKLKTKDGQSILKLQDVFDKYKNKIYYVIELKENSKQTNHFINIMKQNKLTNNIILQASEIEPLDKIAKTFPRIKRLLLVETQDELNKALTYENVDIVSAHKELMNADNVQRVHEAHKIFNAWTLNSDTEIKTAIHLSVDTYFTDFTAKAFVLERKYR